MIETIVTLASWGFALGFGAKAGAGLASFIADTANGFAHGWHRGRNEVLDVEPFSLDPSVAEKIAASVRGIK
jgi:hypothetical protein